MPRTHKTPVPWPDRRVSCSRTPTKHRTWNPVWENTQTEHDYIHGPNCERSSNLSTCQKLQQGGWLHIKFYMAAGSQFTETLSTTRPSVITFWLPPLTRRVASHFTPGQTEIYSAELVLHLVTSFGTTKPPAQPEDGDGVSSWNVIKPSHLDTAVCPRKFHIHICFSRQ